MEWIPWIVAASLVFAYLNGFHDSASLVAVVISSRAMSPRAALLWSAFGDFLGPFLLGVAVARVIGHDLFNPEVHIAPPVVLAGILGAITWNLMTWRWGLPSSSTHALVGGMIGAVVIGYGPGAVQLQGLGTVILALLMSAPLGFVMAYILHHLLYRLVLVWVTPRFNTILRRLQFVTTLLLAISHGSNDAQKTMGLIVLGMTTAGLLKDFSVPLWVQVASAGALALGTATGGWRMIHTLGRRIFRIRPVHGFIAQVAGGLVISGASWLGGPVSATQVLASSILGTGAAERLTQVRWMVARNLILAWVMTIPAAAFWGVVWFFILLWTVW